jgi:hypothetical protein
MILLSVGRWKIIFKDLVLPLVDRFCEHASKELSATFRVQSGWMKADLVRVLAHPRQLPRRKRRLGPRLLLPQHWRCRSASPLILLKPETSWFAGVTSCTSSSLLEKDPWRHLEFLPSFLFCFSFCSCYFVKKETLSFCNNWTTGQYDGFVDLINGIGEVLPVDLKKNPLRP